MWVVEVLEKGRRLDERNKGRDEYEGRKVMINERKLKMIWKTYIDLFSKLKLF